MKKFKIFAIFLLLALGLVGCANKDLHLSTDDNITTNTLLMKRDGTLQVATVEEFQKQYYNLNELNEFISKEINTYNKKVGKDEISIAGLSLKKNLAVLLLNYSGMKHYSNFNKVPAAYFSTSTENISLELPEEYLNTNGVIVDKASVFKNGKLRVLVVYEPYKVIVDGKIKYVSKNAKLLSSNTIESSEDGLTVVVYKPSN